MPGEDFETDPSSQIALIVAAPVPDVAADLLHERGWDVRHCPGPRKVACPLIEGDECPIRVRSDAAIVYVDATTALDLGDAAALVMCAGHTSAPAVAVVPGDVAILDPLKKVHIFRDDVGAGAAVDAMEATSRHAVEGAER